MVGELGRIFRTERRRRDLGAAGRRHEAPVPRHHLPRRQDRLDRRQGGHRLCARRTAAPPGRPLKTGSNRHLFALEFANAAARARRRRLRHHGAHRGRRRDLDREPRARGREAARERPRHRRRARRRQPLRHLLRRRRPRLARRRVRHRPGEHRRRADLARSRRPRSRARSSASASSTRSAAGRSASTPSSCAPRTAARPGGCSTRPIAARSLYDVVVRGAAGLDRRRLRHRAADRATAAPPGQLEPLPIQLAAHWLRAVWLVADGRGLAVGAEGLVFRIDGATLERLRAARRRGARHDPASAGSRPTSASCSATASRSRSSSR